MTDDDLKEIEDNAQSLSSWRPARRTIEGLIAELRRLRTENRLLWEKYSRLDAETGEITPGLPQDQLRAIMAAIICAGGDLGMNTPLEIADIILADVDESANSHLLCP